MGNLDHDAEESGQPLALPEGEPEKKGQGQTDLCSMVQYASNRRIRDESAGEMLDNGVF